jgi:aryl-alcohol dehydrogenase-like predicted oxidoreductase
MRYRPLGVSGMSVSTVSLRLDDTDGRGRPADWRDLIYAAFENGVNAFEVTGRSPAIAEGLAAALPAVERRLVMVAWRMGEVQGPAGAVSRDFSPRTLRLSIESVIARTGLGYLDAVILDDPRGSELTVEAVRTLKEARDEGRVRLLGVAGEGEAIDAYITSGVFDILATGFNMTSGWKQRLRLKTAVERNMGILGYDYHVEALRKAAPAPVKTGLLGGRREALEGVGGYGFLDATPGWKAEELSLAYALTEPCLASVQVVADKRDRLAALADVTERDLPPGVSAQIEMARFGPTGAQSRRA